MMPSNLFNEVRRKAGLAPVAPLERSTPGMDALRGRVSALENDLADYLPADEDGKEDDKAGGTK
jgi:hypothetical protein